MVASYLRRLVEIKVTLVTYRLLSAYAIHVIHVDTTLNEAPPAQDAWFCPLSVKGSEHDGAFRLSLRVMPALTLLASRLNLKMLVACSFGRRGCQMRRTLPSLMPVRRRDHVLVRCTGAGRIPWFGRLSRRV